MRKYYIYSTPRSGSAWVANFLSSGDCFCAHEPAAIHRGERYEWDPDYRSYGIIDTGAWLNDSISFDSDVEIFYLTRKNKQNIKKSLAQVDKWLPGIASFSDSIDRFKEVPGRTFYYEDIFSPLGFLHVQRLWEATNGEGFDIIRASQLLGFNVQVTRQSVYNKLASWS